MSLSIGANLSWFGFDFRGVDGDGFFSKNACMKTLILQHTQTSPPGTTVEWMRARGIPFHTVMTAELSQWPAMDSFDVLVICGGGMNVDQEDLFPWLKEEKAFIANAIAQKKKIVGLCLGAQLLAEVLGAKVYRHSAWETGWHPVQLPEGETLMAFEWHAYTFDLPMGAERLGTNSQCRNQAYKMGKNILAFQFHPEADEEWIQSRTKDAEAPTKGFIQTAQQVLEGIPKYLPTMQRWYFQKLDELILNPHSQPVL